MQKTTIKTISKSKNIDYGNEEINNFWLKINDINKHNNNNNLSEISAVFKEVCDSVICIQTEELNHPDLIKTIYQATKNNNRIYILTNEKDISLKQFEGVCLMRYGIKNMGSFVLINPNQKSEVGILYTAPFLESSLANEDNLVVNLDSEQIQTLFRFFSDNFWNNTEYEIIEDFNTPQKVNETPIDVLSNINDFCDEVYIKNKILDTNTEAIISISGLQTNNLLNSNLSKNTILSSFKNNNVELLKKLALSNSIFANSQNTTNLIINNNGDSWLIPKTHISKNESFFALKLNRNQVDNFDDLINDKIDNSEFKFHISSTRQKLENKTIWLLDNLEKKIKIQSASNDTSEDIVLNTLTSKDEFDKLEPAFKDDGISASIQYTWNTLPFTKPSNAKKAKLYSEWENFQKEYNTYLEKIDATINESQNKNVGEKLKRFFLGKKQTISRFKSELDNLRKSNLSDINIQNRSSIIDQVNTLANNVNCNLLEINAEIKKSNIDSEIQCLVKEKEVKNNELNRFIDEQIKKYEGKEAQKMQELNVFLKANGKEVVDLRTFKSELTQQSGKKNKNKNPEEAKMAQNILEELNSIQGFDFKKKYEEDKYKHDKEIKNIENKIKNKEKELIKVDQNQVITEGSSLNYAVGNKGRRGKLTENTVFSIPDAIDFLPKVGVLYEIGKQKYLEIEFWEDFELGQIEAKRLNAKLSAKPNS